MRKERKRERERKRCDKGVEGPKRAEEKGKKRLKNRGEKWKSEWGGGQKKERKGKKRGGDGERKLIFRHRRVKLKGNKDIKTFHLANEQKKQ